MDTKYVNNLIDTIEDKEKDIRLLFRDVNYQFNDDETNFEMSLTHLDDCLDILNKVKDCLYEYSCALHQEEIDTYCEETMRDFFSNKEE